MRPSSHLLALGLLLGAAPALLAQQAPAESELPGSKEWYFTGSGEWIFSMPILDVNGSDKGSVVRFSPFFNLQMLANYDASQSFGFFTGLSVRNLGFIYDAPEPTGADIDVRYKFRSYTLGVPVGIKIGKMHKGLLFAGYELELPFAYKEKRFENDDRKDRFDVWFSDRTEPLFHSVMLGFQGPRGTSLKFKYYLTNFHNKDFTENVEGVDVKPYAGLNANILYVSLSADLFNGKDFVTKRKKKQKNS